MKNKSSATTGCRIAFERARRLAVAARGVWDEGVYVNELLLSGPPQPESPLRWRRRRDGWTLVGSVPPLAPRDVEAAVSPRPAPSSC